MLVLVMMREIHRHMDTEELEKYFLGDISQREVEQIEEHLLVCELCRHQLEETEQYITSMRSAAKEIQLRPRKEWRLVPVLTFAACAIALAVVALSWDIHPQPVLAVSLVTTRSSANSASVPAGQPLLLHPDLTGLAPAPSYRLEVVDRNGVRVWNGVLTASDGGARIPSQRAGTYFVRVYATAGELLREYGLEIH